MPRKIFGPKWDEILTGEWRKILNEELYDQ